MRSDLPTGTVTFLFTDVEGSTKLLHELGGEAYAAALAEHRRVIREACAAEGGVEVDTQGDAFFYAFPTAPGAVAAAEAMTAALADGPIQVRIGLHTGTPLVTEEGYVGNDVHFAARVAATSHGGQVVLSKMTAERVELELIDLGEHRLKDIPDAVPIFQLGNGSFPPLKTISNTNLPRPASSFVGRDDELLEVLSCFEDGARLVTLTGPGGTGKTRLAVEAAATLVPEYKAGVFWVGLATLRDPALVTDTIAQTLGAKDGLADRVGDREMLLLLDNLEQVIEAAPALSGLLTACPNLTLLVTSRELLRVQGEVEYAVPPLAEPEAIDLFCARSGLEADRAIAKLCRRLDDLPLAVELAAARTTALTPEQILERLSHRLDMLKGGRDADPRQQTLRATIEWSYELLSPEEQQLFARLSVFAGGCTLEAAEEVANTDLDTLQSLVDKSLVRFTSGRYWMLETIREFAAEKLQGLGEVEKVQLLHLEWAVEFAREAGVGSDTANQALWFRRFDDELSNLRQAIDTAHTLERLRSELELVAQLWGLFMARSLHSEFNAMIARVDLAQVEPAIREPMLRAASWNALAMGDLDRAAEYADQRLAVGRQLSDMKAVQGGLDVLAAVASQRGDFRRARLVHKERLAAAQSSGDALLHAHALTSYAYYLVERGEAKKAIPQLQTARRIAADGTPMFRSYIVGTLGRAFGTIGETQAARHAYVEALQLVREMGNAHHLATLVEAIAFTQIADGCLVDATRLLASAGAATANLDGDAGSKHEADRIEAMEALRRGLDAEELAELWKVGSAVPLDTILDELIASID